MAEEAARVVRIERTFDAPAEDVFDAWTSEEVISRWFRPKEGWREADAEVDLRVGGRIRVVMRTPGRGAVGAGGEYTLIERPHRLAFTWTFDDDPSNEQMIELEFTERGRRHHRPVREQRHLRGRAAGLSVRGLVDLLR